jgi:NADPH:quinone reductase-like Zn-dependent oxidoreductase
MSRTNGSMKAIRIHHSGGPDALLYEEAPRPQTGTGEVLVRVSAAGISPNELSWLGDITKPTIPSHEVSGVVAAVGAEVPELEVGDEVYGLPAFARDGAAAEYVAVRGTEVARKPNSVDHIHAAAIPLSALTAWQALRVHASVTSGQRVLVHGGAGGVGSFAVQLAKHFGAETIATASAVNAVFVKELGADQVIEYTDEPFDCVVRNVDFVLDTVGGEALARSWRVLKPGGTIVSIVEKPSQEVSRTLGARGIYFIVEPNHEQLTELAKLVDSRVLCPFVSKVFPLEQAREAYELGLRGHMRGKIVLRVD